MASADVVSAVATLLEDYDIYSVEELVDLIADPAVAADIAGRLRRDQFVAKLCVSRAIGRALELAAPTYADARCFGHDCVLCDARCGQHGNILSIGCAACQH